MRGGMIFSGGGYPVCLEAGGSKELDQNEPIKNQVVKISA